MPGDDPDFDGSAKYAKDLTAELRTRHSDIVSKLQEAQCFVVDLPNPFTQPLNGPAHEIPLRDVLIDLHDFGILAALLRSVGFDFPVIRINDGAVLVAILPPPGLLQTAFPGLVDFDFRRSDRNKLFASFIAKAF